MQLFNTISKWWLFFTGVWARTNQLKFPGLFSVFLLILKVLWIGWSRIFHRTPILPVSFLSLWVSFHVDQLQLVSPSISCSTVIFIIAITPSKFSYLRESMLFYRSLSDSKSPKISKTLLNILTDLNNTVVWMVTASKSLLPILWGLFQTHQLQFVSFVNFMFQSFF